MSFVPMYMCQIASVITVNTLQYLSWENLMYCSEMQSHGLQSDGWMHDHPSEVAFKWPNCVHPYPKIPL